MEIEAAGKPVEPYQKRACKKSGSKAAALRKTYGWESGRRLSVGRSSSLVLLGSLLPGCFLDCSVLVRRVGLSLPSVTLRENIMLRRRAFTVSNSEVVTMYSCRAGRMRAISFCVFPMRSGVGGCVEKAFGMVPGRRFSSAWMRSKKVTYEFGS